jgi:hypothetical protein
MPVMGEVENLKTNFRAVMHPQIVDHQFQASQLMGVGIRMVGIIDRRCTQDLLQPHTIIPVWVKPRI